MNNIGVIIENITFEELKTELKKQGGGQVWYAVGTCWWTHKPEDVKARDKTGLPMCPRGSLLMMDEENKGVKFLEAAENNISHYGKLGLKTFMAAHNDNCRTYLERGEPWSFRDWSDYEFLINEGRYVPNEKVKK